jgi:transcriptional antiterminator NusG
MNLTEKKSTIMKWYVVRAQSNREKSVSERLKKEAEKGDMMGKIGQVLVPLEKNFFMKENKKVVREKVMYPGYIFVETSAVGELKQLIKAINGATGFLTNRAGDIQPLTQLEVDKMMGEHEANETKEVSNTLCLNEEVKVCDGPFNGFKGIIESIDEDKQKVKVGVLIFGRKSVVELGLLQVQKID